MSNTEVTSTGSQVDSTRLTGRVKWFNTRKGFGFVTVTDTDRSGEDIFVHHTSLNVAEKQYAYLVQGEYVTFETVPMEESDHKEQATNVQGVSGGQLMCETRRQQRIERAVHRREVRESRGDEDAGEWEQRQTKREQRGRGRGRGRGGGRGRGRGGGRGRGRGGGARARE